MDIVGHQVKRELLGMLGRREAIPQAYLFIGPREIGKKRVAQEFAEILIGEVLDDALTHPDLLVIESVRELVQGKVKRKKIGVVEMRRAQIFLSRYPTLAKRRVLIIDEAEELSLGASNALLKILEEPNATSILILVTHKPGSLPSTVTSRLVTFSFDLVPEDELRSYFRSQQKEGWPDFFFTLGLPGLLVRARQKPEVFQAHMEILRSLFQISKLALRERLALAETLARDEEALPSLLEEWLTGMHARVKKTEEERVKRELLLLFERVQKSVQAISERQGNTRLLLEELFLTL